MSKGRAPKGSIAGWKSFGYCRPCNRLVHVTKDGFLGFHETYAHSKAAQTCPGSGCKEFELPEEDE